MLIRFRIWLRKPEVWRFVGFASTVVGLSSYSLSSSFNHLFGEWNSLNTTLYSMFSFIIGLLTLFAKVWQHSTWSLLFKAHMAILVLMATSLYSFFYGKTKNAKPDAYILISCAAFSIMSFSLSRQIQCGFEIDLLYFFLGCLIVQLMQINSLLVIVGGSFSYCLVILRPYLNFSPENEYTEIQVQDQVVIQVDSLSQQDQSQVTIKVNSNSQVSNTDSDSASIIAQFMACIEALKKKNRILILMLLKHLKDKDQPLTTDHNLIVDALPPKIINSLHETVKKMVAAGLKEQCCNVYSSCRREFLEECLWKLGLQKLSIEDIETHSRISIEFRIRKWIKASNVTLRILFPNERRLCDRIFFRFSAADRSFTEVCKEVTNHLLNFADAFPIPRPWPNLLRSNLRVLETLRDLIHEFESFFCDEYSVCFRNEAIAIWKRLGEAIRGIFGELENRICHDPHAAAPSGGLHPVTRYVMNYLLAASRSRHILEHVFEDDHHRWKEYPKLNDREPSFYFLSEKMDRTMELLESNLEVKSKIYKDPALRYVFLMNNSRYVVQKAEHGELGTILGNDWIQKRTAIVRKYRVCYQRSTWKKVFCLLKQDGDPSKGNKKKLMKEKLNLFNMKFEEICRVQSSWFVLDEQLREEIRISLEKIFLPAYENFIMRFQSVFGDHAGEYIKYGVEDIELMLKDLFTGNKVSTCRQKRRESEMLNATVGGKELAVETQRISDIDIINDGYKWRTYRCRIKKGNINPRRCYRCAWLRCPVRKLVERASNDPKTLITTYLGIHNHGIGIPVAPYSDSHCVSKALHNNNSKCPFDLNIVRINFDKNDFEPLNMIERRA